MPQIGDLEAQRLVDTYSDMILRLAYTYLKSTQDAEDICQTVLLKLLTLDKAFENASHEKAWIIRAAINACKDELRAFRRKAVPLETVSETAAPEIPVSDTLEAVMALPKKYREAIYLFYYEGYSIREIARFLHRSEAAVAAQLSRGRKQLKTEIGGNKYEKQV